MNSTRLFLVFLLLNSSLAWSSITPCQLNLDQLRFTSSTTRSLTKLKLEPSLIKKSLLENPRFALNEKNSDQSYVVLRGDTGRFFKISFNADNTTVSAVQTASLEQREAYANFAELKDCQFQVVLSDAAEVKANAGQITTEQIVEAMNSLTRPFIPTTGDENKLISYSSAKSKRALAFTGRVFDDAPFLIENVGLVTKAFEQLYRGPKAVEQVSTGGDFEGIVNEGAFKGRAIRIPLIVQRKLKMQNNFRLEDILAAFTNATYRTLPDEHGERERRRPDEEPRHFFGSELSPNNYVRVVVAVNNRGLHTVVTMFKSTAQNHAYYLGRVRK